MFEYDERMSTSSTVSGIYRNIMKTPAPICTFYFAHPFGVSSSMLANTKRASDDSICAVQSTETKPDGIPGSGYTPWPDYTWKRDVHLLPPLVRLLASKMGHTVPDLETLIHNIRLAWNSPTCRTVLQSASWNIASRSTDHPEPSHCNDNNNIMGSGAYYHSTGRGLLRRRYSVPEIIMRKHSLDNRKLFEENNPSSSDTSTHQVSSGIMNHQSFHEHPCYTIGNTSTGLTNATSMRRQLLRRKWFRECSQNELQLGRWTPPPRRFQRHFPDKLLNKCAKCMQLEDGYASYESLLGTMEFPKKRSRKDSARLSIGIEEGFNDQYPTNITDTTNSSNRVTTSEKPDDTISEISNMQPEFTQINELNENFIRNNIKSQTEYTTDDNTQNQDCIPLLTGSTIATDNQSEYSTEKTLESLPVTNNQNKPSTNCSNIESPRSQDDLVDQYIANLLIDSLNNVIKMNGSTSINSANEENSPTFGNANKVCLNDVELDATENKLCESNFNNPIVKHSEREFYQNNNVDSAENPIYFPKYTSESEHNQFLISSLLSDNEQDCFDREPIIAVQSGSTYPNGDFLINASVPRFVHRTESMEVQRASASPYNCDSDNSLVDSLEDPTSPRPDAPAQTQLVPNKCQYEKGQSFFVPINDSDENSPDNDTVDMDLTIESAMPKQLREKMMKRLQAIDARNHTGNSNHKLDKKNNKNQSISPSGSGIMNKQKQIKMTPAKVKNNLLRTEVGLLETYKIDARGNLQFETPAKPSLNSRVKTQSVVRSLASGPKRPQPKKPSISRRSDIISIKRSQTKKSTISTNQRRKEVVQDMQHMTLYKSDLVTPDIECGPRRMYQKTEIHDGAKRIEILEIVECIDSSCGNPSEPEVRSLMDQQADFRSAPHLRRSKIPVPVIRTGSIGCYVKAIKADRTESIAGRVFVKSHLDRGRSGNSKVDQMIADLLIDALNNPKELGIEFVRSPSDCLDFNNTSSASQRRSMLSRKRSPCNAVTSTGRSASGATKYHQIFDVIPEEKSSMSVDSSTDECGSVFKSDNGIKQGKGDETFDVVISTSNASVDSPGKSVDHFNRGKEAVERDSDAAWIGFFRQQDESLNEDTHLSSNYVAESSISASTSMSMCLDKPPVIATSINESPSTTESKYMLQMIPIMSTQEVVSAARSDNTLADMDICGTTQQSSVLSSVVSTIEQPIYSNPSTNCVQCRMIDMEIYAMPFSKYATQHSSIGFPNNSSSAVAPIFPSHENNVASPIASNEPDISFKKSLCAIELEPNKPPSTPEKTEIDSTSFIISRDEVASSIKLPLPTNRFSFQENAVTASTNDLTGQPSERCSDCCFCNPELHKRSRSLSRNSCSYNNCLNTNQWKHTNSPRSHSQEKHTKSTNTRPHQFYETLLKTDHTHIRTRSKESDTISLKCTRINSQIRRMVPEDSLNGYVFEDKDIINEDSSFQLPKYNNKTERSPTVLDDATKPFKTTKPSSGKDGIRLPSPFNKNASSSNQSSDSTSSSSSHCSSSECSKRPSANNKCPPLPVARWQNHNSAGQPSTTRKPTRLVTSDTNKIRASRYHHFNGHSKHSVITNSKANVLDKGTVEDSPQNVLTQQTSGWSLTLAGTYRDDMAPDVEMRLSFPKRSPTKELDDERIHTEQLENNNTVCIGNLRKDIYAEDGSATNRSISHPPNIEENNNSNRFVNAKRTLSKPNTVRTKRNSCNLPKLNKFDRAIGNQSPPRTIKQSEFSVAVASATTNTISRYRNEKRAMSYQSLNANTFRIDNRERKPIREHSDDIGCLSSRRISLDNPSVAVSEGMSLSILGNAIAPEQKPKVPTMSERDLTRKPSTCFTRNRTLFS